MSYSEFIGKVNKKGIAGVIDFSDKKIDDPARDFTELWDYGSDFVNEVYKNYKGSKDKNFLKELETHLHITSIYHVPEKDYQRAIRALEERVKAKKSKEAGHEQRRMASVA